MITKYQKFRTQTIQRKSILNAPYNPRVIDDYAFNSLKANIKRIGLLETLVWNERTGNLVSGHQRIKILDILNKTDDYELTVSVVNLSEKEEKEQNIFFNSKSVQGDFDESLLKQILPEIDFKNAGLDEADMTYYGIEIVDDNQFRNELKEDFIEPEQPKKQFSKEAIKEAKKNIKENAMSKVGEAEKYVSLSFESLEQKRAFLLHFGYNQDELFLQGARVMNELGIC